MEFLKINLLYKIDLIFFGGHCRYCLEMAVKVALVKKTAFQGNLRQFKTFLQKSFGKFYFAVQSICMRCYACGRLKLSEQRVRVGLQF